MKSKIAATALVLVLLTFAGAKAELCTYPSKTFKGLCMDNRNCAGVCVSESYTGGYCQGVRRQCLCTKDCEGYGVEGPQHDDGDELAMPRRAGGHA
ncbi:hypothetical protein ACP70R_029693 [Stipagrostis hirtigluma subsp. patula]